MTRKSRSSSPTSPGSTANPVPSPATDVEPCTSIRTSASPAATAPTSARWARSTSIRRSSARQSTATSASSATPAINGLSQEHLNPTLVRTMRKVFQALRLRFDPEPDVCPTAAFEPDELTWPRVVRRAFSDPRVPHESTGVEGRGTEEVKTNDVTGRVKAGEVGFTIEFGRPGVGVWFRDIQEMCWTLASAGVDFEKKNPITSLMSDVATGTLREDILNEKLMSAIVEIKVPVARDRRDRPPRVGRREADRHRRGARRRRALRRATATIARSRRSSSARLQPRARQDQHRARHESRTRVLPTSRPPQTEWRLDDQYPASIRRRRELPRRLRRHSRCRAGAVTTRTPCRSCRKFLADGDARSSPSISATRATAAPSGRRST